MRPSRALREFERAYRAEASYVAALMARLAVPEEAISDAVQDVFVAAYRRWPEFDRTRAVRPWLTGFARHVAFRYRRSAARRNRRGAHFAACQPRQSEPGPHQQTDARDFLSRFLAQIDPGHRRAFLLADYEGMTAPEIATTLGISTEAVYGRVRSTRRRLKRALMADLERRPKGRAAAFVRPWSVLALRLSSPTTAGLPATLGGAAAGVILKVAVVVAVGVVGLRAVANPNPNPNPQPRASVAKTAGLRARPRPGDGVQAVGPPTASPRVPSPTLRPVVAPPRRPAVGTPRRDAAATDGASAPATTLLAEAIVLREARHNLERGDARAALERLSEHERLYPQGQLADARRRTRIRALCDLGHGTQARAEAQHMAAARPQDPLAQQALSICAVPLQPAIQIPALVEKSR